MSSINDMQHAPQCFALNSCNTKRHQLEHYHPAELKLSVISTLKLWYVQATTVIIVFLRHHMKVLSQVYIKQFCRKNGMYIELEALFTKTGIKLIAIWTKNDLNQKS